MVFRDTAPDGTVRLTGGMVGGGGEPGAPGDPGPPGADGEDGTNGTNGTDGLDQMIFQANGVLTTKTWPTAMYVAKAGNYRVRATCRDRGSGSSLIVNVLVGGFAALSGTDRPTVASGAGIASDASTVTIALVVGDFITGIVVDQVGTDWSTLIVQLIKE